MATVKVLPPGCLQVERLPDGRRRLLRDLNLEIGGRKLSIPAGFVTDYSSWPPLPGPRWSKIDVAGVVHDWLFRSGRWNGDPVSFIEANRTWFDVARSGEDPKTRASWLWAWIGRLGLALFSWPVWLRYRAHELAEKGIG